MQRNRSSRAGPRNPRSAQRDSRHSIHDRRHRTGSRALVFISRAISFRSQLTADGVRHAIRLDMARKKAVSVSPAALGDDSDSSCRGLHSSHHYSHVSREISKPRADVETVNGPGCAPKRRPSRQGWRSKLGQRHTSRGDREAGGEAADDVHRGLEQIAGLNECERFPRPR
jgi:hypothetical protein